jgi:hypothetical protein
LSRDPPGLPKIGAGTEVPKAFTSELPWPSRFCLAAGGTKARETGCVVYC